MNLETKMKSIYKRAAVVCYVEHPITGRLIVRPKGCLWPVRLMIDVN
jgi:hypothetical protein